MSDMFADVGVVIVSRADPEATWFECGRCDAICGGVPFIPEDPADHAEYTRGFNSVAQKEG